MLKCSISREQRIRFGTAVGKELLKSVRSDKPFDMKVYMKKIFDKVLAASENEAKALDYARQIPVNIDQLASRVPEIKAGLRKQGFSRDALDDLILEFSNPENGLTTTRTYLEVGNAGDALEKLKALNNEDNEEEIPPGPKDGRNTKTDPVTSPGILQSVGAAIRDFFVKTWQSYAPTAFADVAVEAPFTGPNKNVPYTNNEQFLFKVKRNLLKALQKQSGSIDSSALDYEGYGPVHLTTMSIQQIEDQVGNEIDLTFDPERTGVFMVLTNVFGEPMKFDTSGMPTIEGGNIAYYKLRNTDKVFNEAGEYIVKAGSKKRDDDRIRALAALRKISKSEAKAQYMRELQMIDDIRKHIAKDPQNNTVRTFINGGSLGMINQDVNKFRHSLTSINKITDIKIAGEQDLNLKPGTAYFVTENSHGMPLEVERPVIGVNSRTGKTEFGNVDMLLDLVLGNLKNEFGNDISYSQREEFVEKFLFLNSNRFNMKKGKDGRKYYIRLRGDNFFLDTAEQIAIARTELKKYLTELVPQNTISKGEAYAKEKNNPNVRIVKSIAAGKINDVLEVDGVYSVLGQTKIHVNKNIGLKTPMEMPILNKNDDGSITYTIDESTTYEQFLSDNFYSSADIRKNGDPNILNAYFTFDVSEEVQKELYPGAVEENESPVDEGVVAEPDTNISTNPDTSSDDELDNFFNRSDEEELYKILDVKDKDLKATKEQIAAAKVWYEKSPLSKYMPFKEAFNLINTKNPNAVASWAVSGITLFKGADYSDLYHEAWHGFSQAFMTPQQKKELYKEVGNKSGSFMAFDGKRVTFSNANDKQIEEWLAEEFRTFMLGGQKATKGAPKQNSLFRRIYNFLKTLFTGTTEYEMTLNQNADKTVSKLFNKLRVGDLNQYTFSADNVQFGELESGILALENREGVNKINIEDSNTINESLDALFGEFIDMRNTGLNIKDQNELAKLKAQFAGGFYKKLPAAERNDLIRKDKERMQVLSSKTSYSSVSDVVKNDKVRMKAYGYAHFRLKKIRDEYAKAYDTETNAVKKAEIGKDLELLNFTLREFGKFEVVKDKNGNDVKKFLGLEDQLPAAGEPVRGVIASHMFKSKLFSDAEIKLDYEDMDETDVFLKGKEGYTRNGTENSLKALAKTEIVYMIQGLQATDKKGAMLTNRFGITKLHPFQATWNRLARALQNSPNIDSMYERLQKEAKSFPQAQQIRERLGPIYNENSNSAEVNLWTNFWQAFNKTRVPLIQMTVTREVTGEGAKYTSTIGEAFNADYAIGKRWESEFQAAQQGQSKFIKRDSKGNFIDIDAVLKAFPKDTLNEKAFEFYRAIGFDLTDTPEIRNAIRDNVYRFGPIYFRNDLEKLKTKKDRKGKINKVRSLLTLTENLGNRFKALQILEAKYSDVVSNFMVTNAEGNTQFEHTLNNTMTVMVNGLNDTTKDYKEIVAQRYMAHLDVKKNPFSEASIWMKSMFRLDLQENDPNYGKRRTNDVGDFVTLRLTNLSGVLIKDIDDKSSDGIAAAKSDGYTKLILDLHLSYFGTPEMMRHADKGTSYSLSLDGPIIGSKTSQYVPAYLFSEDTESDYQLKTYSRLLPHIIAEMKRMREMRNLDGIEEYDFKYAEDGKNFTIFDDVLDPTTKDVLEKIVNTDQDINEAINNSLDVRKAIQNTVSNYFENQYTANKKLFKDASFTTSNIIEQIQKEAKAKGVTMNNASAKDALIRSYTTNSFIHNVESLALFYGDLALFNHAKEGFHKRNAGAGSTGDLYRTDIAMQNYINGPRVAGTSYAKKNQERLGLSDMGMATYNGTFPTAVVTEQQVKSAYYDDYVKALGKAGAKAYGEKLMDEADAQGLITFDGYRELKIAEGDWSTKQDQLFEDIVNGKRVDPKRVTEFFPVIKAQYWGPLQTKGMSLMGMHKYSLMPLIPTVIKNKNAEALHDKMIKEGIKYLTFESGSKVSTITKKGGPDALYLKNRTLQLNTPFTKNVIHLEYLKNQLAIASKSKGNVIFSTQLRKLIEDGLMEGGVPTDFKPSMSFDNRITAWEKIKDKEGESPRYKLLLEYERNIAKLTQYQKDKLLKDMNWTSKIVDGVEVLDGKMGDLIKMVKRELGSRGELAEHELDFIDVQNGKLKEDLSLSFSVEKIEKILNALMVKRLIKQKVNGEGLIQVASTMFEEMNGAEGYNYTNANDADNKKYGTNDLPTYQQGVGKDGTTSAMKVKVALQGSFMHLLDMNDLDGNRIGTIKRLNQLIRDDKWLDAGRHREMVTMVGVRIPVQGLNSMEFMEVYEFLPAEAGSIIIPPSEIVAKSGADFDVDKMTIMMPNIRKAKRENGMVTSTPQMWNWSEEEIQENYDKYIEAQKIHLKGGDDATVDGLIAALWGVSVEDLEGEIVAEIAEMIKTGEVKSLEEFKKEMLNDKAIQNDLLTNIRSILALPENFVSLVRPNSTDIFDDLAAKLGSLVNDYDQYNTVNGKSRMNGDKKMISPTRTLEVGYNLFKHVSNAVGKETLGLGAVDNTYNSVFNRIGMYMNPTAGMTTKEYNKLAAKKNPSKNEQKRMKGYHRQKLFLKHNTRKVGDESGISLAHIMDANNEHKVSDVINQMMNGWVDIAADTWIFNVQGNKEVSPVLLFMVQSGVPIKDAIYFSSMPLVREYVKEQKLAKSTFAQPLGKAPEKPAYYRGKARTEILTSPEFGFDMAEEDAKFPSNVLNEAVARITEDVLNDEGTFDIEKLRSAIVKESAQRKKGEAYEYTDVDRAAFLHFLEVEEMSKAIRDIKMKMNVDTSKDGSLFEAQNRIFMKEDLKRDARIPSYMVDRILTDSPIGSFFIQPFQIESLGKMFPLRNDKNVNGFIMASVREDFDLAKDTSGDAQKFANDFKNDLPLYLFQNALRGVDVNDIKYYNGYTMKSGTVKKVPSLKYGAYVEDGVLYVDVNELNRQFTNKTYQEDNAFGLAKVGNAKVNAMAFQKPEEYYKFVLERETLRASTPITSLAKNTAFTNKLDFISENLKQKETESAEQFEKRKVQKAYELWLRDKALDNSYNYWNMFQSNNTYAQQFTRIKEKHDDLSAYFSLIGAMSIDVSPDGRYKNLTLNNTSLTADEIDQYHENLVNLSDPRKLKEIVPNKTKEELDEITEFFKRMPVIAFLQSGMNTRSKYSLVRIVPQKPIMNLINKPVKAFMNALSNEKNKGVFIMKEFLEKFKVQNGMSNRVSKIRGKDYFTGTVIKAKGFAKAGLKTDALDLSYANSMYNPAQKEFDPSKGRTTLIQELADNPGNTYVYNRAADAANAGTTTDSVMHTSTNALGLPTRAGYNETGGERSTIIRDKDGAIEPTVKEAIDSAIDMLVEKKSNGENLVFNKEGYGQDMLDKNRAGNRFAPQTFLYLSKQLFDRLGYLNPKYVQVNVGREVVQAKQEVSDIKIIQKNDQAVRDFMNQCMG